MEDRAGQRAPYVLRSCKAMRKEHHARTSPYQTGSPGLRRCGNTGARGMRGRLRRRGRTRRRIRACRLPVNHHARRSERLGRAVLRAGTRNRRRGACRGRGGRAARRGRGDRAAQKRRCGAPAPRRHTRLAARTVCGRHHLRRHGSRRHRHGGVHRPRRRHRAGGARREHGTLRVDLHGPRQLPARRRGTARPSVDRHALHRRDPVGGLSRGCAVRR